MGCGPREDLGLVVFTGVDTGPQGILCLNGDPTLDEVVPEKRTIKSIGVGRNFALDVSVGVKPLFLCLGPLHLDSGRPMHVPIVQRPTGRRDDA